MNPFDQLLRQALTDFGCATAYSRAWKNQGTDFLITGFRGRYLRRTIEVRVSTDFDFPEHMDAFLHSEPIEKGSVRAFFEVRPIRSFRQIAEAFFSSVCALPKKADLNRWVRLWDDGQCLSLPLSDRINAIERDRDRRFAAHPQMRGFIIGIYPQACLLCAEDDPQKKFWATNYHLAPETRASVQDAPHREPIPVVFVHDYEADPYPHVTRVQLRR
ncbi:MAG TPA: hypothetical protein VFQ60_03570 [Patescibacteria group bacterium]|nr:hypothetical protein [Patescibacteria group bacterium]